MLAALAGLTISSAGQVADSAVDSTKREEPRYTPRLPATATFKITKVKAGADGEAVTREWTEVLAYTRRWQMHSTSTVPEAGSDTPGTQVEVLDREARTISRWNVPGQQVTVTNLPAQVPGAPLCATHPIWEDPVEFPDWMKKPHGGHKPVNQSLGIRTILGIEARGSRTTFTNPGGVGNEETFGWTQEVWMATQPGVGLLVRTITDYPWSGKTTRELVDIDMNEPNPSVFQPPAGYATVKKDAPGCPASSAEHPAEPVQ